MDGRDLKRVDKTPNLEPLFKIGDAVKFRLCDGPQIMLVNDITWDSCSEYKYECVYGSQFRIRADYGMMEGSGSHMEAIWLNQEVLLPFHNEGAK